MRPEIPPNSYHFEVSFTDKRFAKDRGFQSVAGLQAQLVFPNEHSRRPTDHQFGDLTLSRALDTDSKLASWFLEVIHAKKLATVDLSIALLNSEHEAVVRWYICGALPIRWEMDEFDALRSGIAMERFSFRCESISLNPPKKPRPKPTKGLRQKK
ncbi:phage tail protein [Croceiramulus getboli]|nr:phage tail protein [Flavobacteriaceae bacterium YJPT1-3]